MTTENNFSCVFCKETFDRKVDLQIHFRKHADPNQHRIMQINSKLERGKFTAADLLEEEKDSIECDVCPEVFSVVSKALKHARKAHPEYDVKHFCSWCGQFFTIKQLFNKHLLSHENCTNMEADIYCDVCNVTFYQVSAMNYHNKFFHREGAEMPDIGHSKKLRHYDKDLVPLFYCPFCGEENINKINLHKHMTEDHVDEEQTPLSILRCPLCEAIFYSSSAYETHLSFHSVNDVYTWSEHSNRQLPTEFTLETVPPKEEVIENYSDDVGDAMGVEQLLQLSMGEINEDNESPPVKKHKKHKKHKKSKKEPITLDQFLNMNTDVFGEDLDFQGVEEVPTKVVKKQFKKVKPPTVKQAKMASAATLQKLKLQGIVVKKKGSKVQVLPGTKVRHLPIGKVINANVKPAPKILPVTADDPLTKLLTQGLQLKISKKQLGKESSEKIENSNTEEVTRNEPSLPVKDGSDISMGEEKKEVKNVIALPYHPISNSETKETESNLENNVGPDYDKNKLNNINSTIKTSNASDPLTKLLTQGLQLKITKKPAQEKDTALESFNNDHIIKTQSIMPMEDDQGNSTDIENEENSDKKVYDLPYQPTPKPDEKMVNSDNDEEPTTDDKIKLFNNPNLTIKSMSNVNIKKCTSPLNVTGNINVLKSTEKAKAQKNTIDKSKTDAINKRLLVNSRVTVKPFSPSKPDIKNAIDNKNYDDNNETDHNNSDHDDIEHNNHDKAEHNKFDHDKTEYNDDAEKIKNNIEPVNCPKTKLLSNSQITIKSSKTENPPKNLGGVTKLAKFSDVSKLQEIPNLEISHQKENNLQVAIPKKNDNMDEDSDIDDHFNSDFTDTDEDVLKPMTPDEIGMFNAQKINCPTNKIFKNAQLTVKNMKKEMLKVMQDHSSLGEPSCSDMNLHSDGGKSVFKQNICKQENKSVKLFRSGNKLVSNSQVTMTSSSLKQSNASVKNASKVQKSACSDDQWSSGDDMSQQSNKSVIKNVNPSEQDSHTNSTNKLLSNTQLTVKTPVKRVQNEIHQRKVTTNVSDSRNKVVSCEQSTSMMSRQVIQGNNEKVKTLNTIKNFKGISIKQERPSTPEETSIKKLDDDYIECISSDDDVRQPNRETKLEPSEENSTKHNALAKIQKLGLGVTLKSSIDNKSVSKDVKNNDSDTDDENYEQTENSVSEENNEKHESIVNKLKNTNLGLSIKSLKNSEDSMPSTNEADDSNKPPQVLRDMTGNPSNKKTNNNSHINNLLSNNKNIIMKTPQKLHTEQNETQNRLNVKKFINKNSQMQSVNEASTSDSVVSQEVTVKQIQTKTVIQEITTTVTKTIRTVNQTVSEEVSTALRNQSSLVRPSTNPRPKIAGPMIRSPMMAPNQRPRIRPPTNVRMPAKVVRPNIRSQNPPIRPTKPVPCRPQAPQKLPVQTPNQNQQLPMTYKCPPNVTAGVKRQVDEKPGPFSCFKRAKESLIPGDDIEDLIVKHVTTAQSCSQVLKQNAGVKTVAVKSAQMKTEYSATTKGNQVSNSSFSSVKTSSVQKVQMEASSRNMSLIEKLKQQGLLVKKPGVELNEGSNDDHMDDGDDT